VTLEVPDVPEVGEQLAGLVAAERECCAFLGWTLVRTGSRWQLTIDGTDEELDSLSIAN
jgi:hypothetical protein